MSLTFYWYPNCSTCRNAKKWLETEGIDFNPIHIVEETPTKEEIKELIEISNIEPRKFFNTSGKVYREENLKEVIPTATLDEMATLLAGNGMLIKRPILTDVKSVAVGFKEADYERICKTK